MKSQHTLLPLTTAVMLAACGGNVGDGAGPAHPSLAAETTHVSTFAPTALVTFGDSLSDAGAYAVGAIAAAGGGRFTINGDASAQYPALNGRLWNDVLAVQFNMPAQCAAETGLQGDPARGLAAPVAFHAGCTNYAQGGARVTEPLGPGSAADGSPIGQLTVPVTTQMASHLAAIGGRFGGNELVLVMAGANDVVALWEGLYRGAIAATQTLPPEAAAQARAAYYIANGPAAQSAAAAIAGELVALVRSQVVAAGANYVVVNNVPDLSSTPLGAVQAPELRAQVKAMVQAFNAALKAGLDAEPAVVQVDVFALTADEVVNPAVYGLTNVTAPACGPNALNGHSLICTVGNVYPGVDISHFLFADTVHPTPYGHALMAQRVMHAMAVKGWL